MTVNELMTYLQKFVDANYGELPICLEGNSDKIELAKQVLIYNKFDANKAKTYLCITAKDYKGNL